MASSLPKIAVDSTAGASPKPAKFKSKAKVADSWEDEDESEPELTSPEPATTPSVPSAPPPTPISPSMISDTTWQPSSGLPPSPAAFQGGADAGKRPEKTDAVARRMIAAGLGLKAPKQTEEQKAYQKSIREQEKRRRELEKQEETRRQEEESKAKAAVWGD
ncbi:hypothetical protein S7711_00400 [Stachybotrys chartarum IBT 7711]|uniref:Uncharacterized protein n=1 Tax=Stachybotrys chartarum (strain CBS 109288 / IBT 7711) TaxID=1280523 RepID=A0A084B9L3_STACB|nr:hypothetical protein S7711_00400 [Stachybotrys chartarum IBT 7711]KFA72836.1 hypothetical protein S40288_08558 [Stachybotrys chartarum IBT 40288]